MVEQFAYRASFPGSTNTVLGIAFSPLTRERLVERMLRDTVPNGDGARLLVTANLDHLSNLARNVRFRAAYSGAWAATADGMPVYLYSRMRGAGAPERVTGADLFADLMSKMAPPACVPFFVVGQEEAGKRLTHLLVGRGFAPENVAYACPPFGFETNPEASNTLIKAIREHGTTHLFFGLGAPKSEVWIYEHRTLLGDTYALAVGASLDFCVGLRKRAPIWMQNFGLEWAWRVGREPRRLFRRYFIESWIAVWAVTADLFGFTTKPAAYDRCRQPTQETV